MDEFEEKKRKLLDFMKEFTREDTAVAFSGGADSSLVLKAACDAAAENGTEVYAYTVHTMLHPTEEIDITGRIAADLGAVRKILNVDELREAGIEENPEDRCYLCKKYMFLRLKADAAENGILTVMEGTNADDTRIYRPGIRAVKELGIVSPLLLSGFTKKDVRRMAGELGIVTADRPSSPCLATRFPYGTHLDRNSMLKVEKIEDMIRKMGFYNVRARVHGSLIRIEVDREDIGKLVGRAEEITEFVRKLGFDYVAADLEGFRSGSQDIRLRPKEEG